MHMPDPVKSDQEAMKNFLKKVALSFFQELRRKEFHVYLKSVSPIKEREETIHASTGSAASCLTGFDFQVLLLKQRIAPTLDLLTQPGMRIDSHV